MERSITADFKARTLTAFAPFTKVEDRADGTVYCEGVATAEVVDSHGEVVRHDASVRAFSEWTSAMAKATDGLSMGNIREMHQPSAAGKAVLWRQDDDAKSNTIGVVVVDPDACAKVRSRVYTGFSIGGDQVEYGTVKVGDATVPAIEAYRLAEVSLVDRPACPAAVFTLVKRDSTPVETAPEDNPADDVPPENPQAPDAPLPEDDVAKPAVEDPAADPGPGATADMREPVLAPGDQSVALVRADRPMPVGWLVTRAGGATEMVPWAKGKLVKGPAEAIASADAALAALKAMMLEVAALPGSPEVWTMGDILNAMQYALSAAYGCKNLTGAADTKVAAFGTVDTITPQLEKLSAHVSKLEAMLAEQVKAKGSPEGPTVADVLQKVEGLSALIAATPAAAKGVVRAVAKRLHGGDDDGNSAAPAPALAREITPAHAVEVLERDGILPEPLRQSVRLALTAASIQRGM